MRFLIIIIFFISSTAIAQDQFRNYNYAYTIDYNNREDIVLTGTDVKMVILDDKSYTISCYNDNDSLIVLSLKYENETVMDYGMIDKNGLKYSIIKGQDDDEDFIVYRMELDGNNWNPVQILKLTNNKESGQ